jgi:hypothetical protein
MVDPVDPTARRERATRVDEKVAKAKHEQQRKMSAAFCQETLILYFLLNLAYACLTISVEP